MQRAPTPATVIEFFFFFLYLIFLFPYKSFTFFFIFLKAVDTYWLYESPYVSVGNLLIIWFFENRENGAMYKRIRDIGLINESGIAVEFLSGVVVVVVLNQSFQVAGLSGRLKFFIISIFFWDIHVARYKCVCISQKKKERRGAGGERKRGRHTHHCGCWVLLDCVFPLREYPNVVQCRGTWYSRWQPSRTKKYRKNRFRNNKIDT